MEAIIKNYMEELCKTDSVLAERYDETIFGKCMEYIYEQAKEMAGEATSIGLKDNIVFGWAKHYYLEGPAAIEKENQRKAEEARIKAEEERKQAEIRKAEEDRIRMEKERDEREHANGQMTIFDLGA